MGHPQHLLELLLKLGIGIRTHLHLNHKILLQNLLKLLQKIMQHLHLESSHNHQQRRLHQSLNYHHDLDIDHHHHRNHHYLHHFRHNLAMHHHCSTPNLQASLLNKNLENLQHLIHLNQHQRSRLELLAQNIHNQDYQHFHHHKRRNHQSLRHHPIRLHNPEHSH